MTRAAYKQEFKALLESEAPGRAPSFEKFIEQKYARAAPSTRS